MNGLQNGVKGITFLLTDGSKRATSRRPRVTVLTLTTLQVTLSKHQSSISLRHLAATPIPDRPWCPQLHTLKICLKSFPYCLVFVVLFNLVRKTARFHGRPPSFCSSCPENSPFSRTTVRLPSGFSSYGRVGLGNDVILCVLSDAPVKVSAG